MIELWDNTSLIQAKETDVVYPAIRSATVLPPYKHQVEGSNFVFRQLQAKGFAALFADMGVGKTKITIDTFTAMLFRGLTDTLLIICPKPLMGVWQDELQKQSRLDWATYRWRSVKSKAEDKRFELFLSMPAPRLAVFNIEALQTPNAMIIDRMARIRQGKVLLAVDESSAVKDMKAKRTKNLVALADKLPYRMILSGTEVVNSPLDLYSQFEVLQRGFWGVRSYFQFQLQYAVLADQYGAGGRTFKKVIGFKQLDELANRIAPHIFRAKKEDCLDLPEKVRSIIHVELTEKQRRYYLELQKHLMTILESGELVSVENKVSLFTKFRQISGGTIKAEGVHLVLEEKPEKLEALLADIATHTDQAIIWAAFTHEILLLARELEKHGGVVLFYGGVDQEQREENIRIFQAGKARFFVANPGSAAFGLNLQNAHLQYVYSRHLSPAVNWQAEDRTHRAGQRSVCVYKTLVARGTVDEGIEVMLAKKTDLREAFRSMDNKAILDLCVLKTEG